MDFHAHESAIIAPGATIGPRTVIGPYAVIARGVTVGADCVIGPHATVGLDGFGYTHNDDWTWTHKPHKGGVVIADDVHIGAHANVHQGTFEPTRIGRGTRVDAHVHVAHNVQIGERCIVVSGAMIAGSCVIEDDVWVGLSACIHQHRTIGAKALVGMGAVVIRDVPPGQKWAGNPARCINAEVGMEVRR